MQDEQIPRTADPTRNWRGFRRWLRISRNALLVVIVTYVLINLAGLIPVNNDFAEPADGVEIMVISNAVHADIVLPISAAGFDWRAKFSEDCFAVNTSNATHVAIGWGDKGFFIETPTWADFRVTTAANALCLPSDCCLHVCFTRAELFDETARRVTISDEHYRALVTFIDATFKQRADGSNILIADAAYAGNDAFFEAHGNYHCFNTCNCWAGRALREAGIRVGCLTAWPKTVYLYLPNETRPTKSRSTQKN